MDVVKKAHDHLGKFSKGGGLTTGKVRSVSAKLFRELEDKNINNVFNLCKKMLDERQWALKIIAFDWAYRVRNQYNDNTFTVFENWLKEYITDWGDCDDFCTHAFGYLIATRNDLFRKVKEWVNDSNFAVRRAAPVVLIYPINHDTYDKLDPLTVSDALMTDEHYLVLKGYGWMLKVLAQKEPEKVIDYLIINKDIMPRVAYRYALEKLDKETKDRLMSK